MLKRLSRTRASPRQRPPPLHPSDMVLVVLGVTQGAFPSQLSEQKHTRCGRGSPLGSMCDSNFTQPGPSVPEVGH